MTRRLAFGRPVRIAVLLVSENEPASDIVLAFQRQDTSGAGTWVRRHPGFMSSERYAVGGVYLGLGLATAAAGDGRQSLEGNALRHVASTLARAKLPRMSEVRV